jgi:hypothetical protein
MRYPLTIAVLFASLTGTAFAQDFQSFDRIERGRYLAVLGDCAGCHTAPGGAPFAGGLALQARRNSRFGYLLLRNEGNRARPIWGSQTRTAPLGNVLRVFLNTCARVVHRASAANNRLAFVLLRSE